MPQSVRESMFQKGWSDKDISQAEDILYSEKGQSRKEQYMRKVNPIIYWMGLLIAIVGNMILSVFMIPFFLVMSDLQLYVIIGTMGLVFGAMFNFLIRDVEYVDQKSHVMAGAFIPVLGIITISVVINISNNLGRYLNRYLDINIWVTSIVYVLCFTAPYLIYKYHDVKTSKNVRAKMVQQSGEKEDVAQSQEQQAGPFQKGEFANSDEAWQVYQMRQQMADNRVEANLKNKYGKYL